MKTPAPHVIVDTPATTATPATPPRWFAAAPVKTRSGRPGEWAWRPWGAAHGRQVGSSQTACGIPATEMTTFFDLPFLTSDLAQVCSTCATILHRTATIGRRPAHRRPATSALTGEGFAR